MKIYGNEEVVQTVAGMIRKGREPHSIMIHGEKGLGKKTLAKYIAAQLMCEEHSGMPCGHCKACRMLEKGVHPDLIIAQANDKGNYPVENIREGIVADSVVMPTEGSMKVYVIPDFDRSTITSVTIQNILLKLIEEPPEHTAVIMTARSKEVFLDTIISRVLSLGMVSVTDSESADFLQNNFPDKSPEEISAAVYAGRGNIGRCSDYIKREQFFYSAAAARDIAAAAAGGSEYDILKAFVQTDGKKAMVREAVYLFSEIVRDACIFRLEGKGSDMSVSCDKRLAAKLSDRLLCSSCTELYDTLEEYIRRIDANCNLSMTVNSLAGQIAQICK